ncbi:uncharacterized protein LOC122060076 isoform X2 [Macadamia integrifolia]|uniref:uncharacterized protein LOC122060076 isoform X2 n=1 Tax=Macadamia integrifolia TaxID=60698 RepID=UPI001C52B5F6|nr:uncharacterized protein LOC122060076 isoform X2 [Macadamia integrifolia]
MGSKQLPEVVATMKVMDEKQHVHLRLNTRKSMIGHLLGAAGAVEAVAIVQNNIIMFLYIITKAGDVGFSWSSGVVALLLALDDGDSFGESISTRSLSYFSGE